MQVVIFTGAVFVGGSGFLWLAFCWIQSEECVRRWCVHLKNFSHTDWSLNICVWAWLLMVVYSLMTVTLFLRHVFLYSLAPMMALNKEVYFCLSRENAWAFCMLFFSPGFCMANHFKASKSGVRLSKQCCVILPLWKWWCVEVVCSEGCSKWNTH